MDVRLLLWDDDVFVLGLTPSRREQRLRCASPRASCAKSQTGQRMNTLSCVEVQQKDLEQ